MVEDIGRRSSVSRTFARLRRGASYEVVSSVFIILIYLGMIEVAVKRATEDRHYSDDKLDRFCAAMGCLGPGVYAYFRKHYLFQQAAPGRKKIKMLQRGNTGGHKPNIVDGQKPYPICLLDLED